MGGGLLSGEDEPAIVVNPNGQSDIVLVCEHAGRVIPKSLGSLGLDETDLSRHFAWDIGAEAVSRKLSALLDAPLILQRYSRLVYDCNRPPESDSAMPIMGEQTPIPGNEGLNAEQKLGRIETVYRPFHAAVSAMLDARAAANKLTILATVHSFTPVFKGNRRNLHLGILHDQDARFADRMLTVLGTARDIVVKRNEPYGPKDGVCHTLNLHAGARGLLNVMIEIRNDLIEVEKGQSEWAERLAKALREAAAQEVAELEKTA
ncbi:MAG: N-formylglutamate amidohydrolase [Rhizobiales bacterium]|nr:N-formylglutamate amidohydrolase [Hyphomicrobiales bacterium]